MDNSKWHHLKQYCLFCQDLVKPQIQFPFLSLNKGRFNCIGQVFLFHPISSSVAISTNILKQYEKKIQNKKSKRREEFVLETSQEDLLTRSIIPVWQKTYESTGIREEVRCRDKRCSASYNEFIGWCSSRGAAAAAPFPSAWPAWPRAALPFTPSSTLAFLTLKI